MFLKRGESKRIGAFIDELKKSKKLKRLYTFELALGICFDRFRVFFSLSKLADELSLGKDEDFGSMGVDSDHVELV